MEHLPLLFLATLVAAIAASAPPGLLNMNAAKVSVEKGKKSGVVFSLGIAVMVMVQAYLSVRIGKFLLRNPEVIKGLLIAAMVVFATLAIYFFFKKEKKETPNEYKVPGKTRNDFVKGLFLASLNFLQIPFYSGLNTFFSSQGLMTYDIIDEVLFILAAGLGTFSVMYLYVFYFNKMESKTNKFSKNSNYILAVLMLVLLVITIIRTFFQ